MSESPGRRLRRDGPTLCHKPPANAYPLSDNLFCNFSYHTSQNIYESVKILYFIDFVKVNPFFI